METLDTPLSKEEREKFRFFHEIPDELRNQAFLRSWLLSRPDKLHEIPVEFVTDEMRLVAIKYLPSALSWIEPTSTPNYLNLILECIATRPDIVECVEVEFLTEEFLYQATFINPMAFFYMMRDGCDRFYEPMSQRIVDLGCGASLNVAYKVMCETRWPTPQRIRNMVTDEQLKKAMFLNPDHINDLKRMGKLHVLTEMIRDGYWLEQNNPIIHNCKEMMARYAVKRPTLHDAVQERFNLHNASISGVWFVNQSVHTFMEAVIRLYPVEQSLPFARTDEQIEIFKGIFTIEELKPHMREIPWIKGMVLENDLGL